MENAEYSGPTPARHQSNIRNILEQVKSGAKNKSEAFSELRGILNSSAGKGFAPPLKRDEEVEVEEDRDESSREAVSESQQNQNPNHSSNSINVAARFTHEDRRILINKLIEKKRRGEEDSPDFEGNVPKNAVLTSIDQDGNYRYGNNQSGNNLSAEEYHGEDENKWGNDQNENYNNNKYEGEREEKGKLNNVEST